MPPLDATSASAPPGEAFEGFSQRFSDLPDYILQITHDIWEGRGIGSLEETYAADIHMRFPAGIARGNAGAIDSTMATLAEFPDRTLLGEDVIWSAGGGDAEGGGETGRYHSSHRILSTGTHTGPGPHAAILGEGGRPTGRPFRIRAMADCAAKGGVIDDEWLVRDVGALVRQLGGEPDAFARALIDLEGGPERCARPLTPETDEPGPYRGRGNANEWGARYAGILTDVMARRFDVIPGAYDRACAIESPGGRSGTGWAEADRFWLGLRSSFPRAAFSIDHVTGREDAIMPPRAAVRWSLWGQHSGWGAFGRPTGARVYVLGISHAEFGPWGLRREWTLVDEVSVFKQIHLHELDG